MDRGAISLSGRPRAGGGGTLAGRRTTRSLVLWSAGIDSTYSVLRLLRETDDRVYTHHVRVARRDDGGRPCRRGALEGEALGRLQPLLERAARAFSHGETRIDVRGASTAAGEASLLAFFAARAARALGFTPFDRIVVGVNGDEDPGWHPDSAACALRRSLLARALRAAWECDDVPWLYLWEPRPSKRSMIEYLPEDVRAATVSCLAPRAVAHDDAGRVGPCGECRKCRAAARRGDGLSPAAARGAAERTPPPFRRLVERQSRTPAPPGEGAASDPRAP